MTNASKYVIVIASLVILGGIGVYGLRNVQDNSAVATSDSKTVAAPKPAATASGDVVVQSADFAAEASDSPGSVEDASPTDEPTPTDTTGTDTVLNVE